MTVPITAEMTWLDSLRRTPCWEPPRKPTIVIAPHPDDETLWAGGLIAAQRRRGVPVMVVAVTDGEAAYPDSPGLAYTRRTEQERALAELGVAPHDIVRLNLPDSNVAENEDTLAVLLDSLVRSDALLVAPWCFDPHPDHEACGRASEKIACQSGASLVSWFFWSWHRDRAETMASLALRRFELDEDLRTAKNIALLHHQSQLQHESGSPILPELLLAPARRSFETFIVHA